MLCDRRAINYLFDTWKFVVVSYIETKSIPPSDFIEYLHRNIMSLTTEYIDLLANISFIF